MGDFARALSQAERELYERADVGAACRRVAMRLCRRERPRIVARLAVPALAMSLCAACVAFGYWLGAPGDDEHHLALTADEPKRERPAGGLPDPRAPRPPALTTGQLLAEQDGGACDFSIDGRSHGTAAELDLPLAVGEYDVVCKRGLKAQHQRVRITAGKTTRVVFAFAENLVEEIDPDEEPSERAAKTGDVGTLVAIAIGGQCKFSVDGKVQGVKSSLRRKVPVGDHTVACQTLKRTKSQTVTVAVDKPGIASFKIDGDDSSYPVPASSASPPPTKSPSGLIDPWGNRRQRHNPGF